MSKSIYSHIGDQWKSPSKEHKALQKDRLFRYRREEATVKVERPTRIDRARALGYKAKQGYIMARTRIRRGGMHKHAITSGRRAKRTGIAKITVRKSLQKIAEERTAKKYPNHPVIMADPKINWICSRAHKGRVHRGLTSSGKKSRGLMNKGKGAEKVRPSRQKHLSRNKQSRTPHPPRKS